jgi:hypothetical protein
MGSRRYEMSQLVAGRILRHFVGIVGVCGLAGYLWLFTRPSADPPIRADGYNYYLYAASWVVYHDASLDAVAQDWNGGVFPDFSGILRWPGTNRWMNRHPIGVSVLMLPFVAAADALTRWSNLPRDGFSLYYQHAAALAGLAYFLVGLAVLRRTLSRAFTPGVTLAALVAITWGTNLFHYAVYDGTFSHAFSFALVCVLIELTDRWWTDPAWWHAPTLGVVAGLVVLVRHPNAMFLLLIPLWRLADAADTKRRLGDLWARRRAIAVMTLTASACVSPQLLLYRQVTGRWLVNSYALNGGGFTFLAPHLYGVLLSTQRGLFFWSPVLAFAIPGLIAARGWARQVRLASASVLALNAWVIASWTEWQYGASFGHRAFIDGFGLLAIFIASSFEAIAARPRPFRIVVGVVVAMMVVLSTAEMIQYWLRIWPVRDITWDQYRSLFLRFR